METILKYFPHLTVQQKERFTAMEGLYREWNEKINVISRKDMDNFYERHVLHSMAIARIISFPSGSRILDVGTGGGFPGIPLAVLFPECSFTLCDSIGKKIKVASAVAQGLGLDNVRCENCRAEALSESYDYVVSRAVADLSDFYPWVRDKYTNAIACLKGGELDMEIENCAKRYKMDPARFLTFDISKWYSAQEWFEGKKIVVITK